MNAVRRVRSVRWEASPSLSSICIADVCAAAMWLRKSTSLRAAPEAPAQLMPCLAFSCTVPCVFALQADMTCREGVPLLV